MPQQGAAAPGLAFKAREIEEVVDVYFYRRLGWVVAHLARSLRLTPNQVSVLAGVAGVIGGALLYDRRLALLGFAFLVLHGIIDSADGQLARMTGQISELGRVLDGVAGYATHAAIYLAIIYGVVQQGGSWSIIAWACLAGVSNIVQAQMYDFHRTAYAQVVVHGEVPNDPLARVVHGPFARIAAGYLRLQRALIGAHADVEHAIAGRANGLHVTPADRVLYRECFYRLVRGWNALGDNGRRFAIGILAIVQRVEWFCVFMVVPMNLVLVALWVWQQRADRRFLGALGATRAPAA